MANLRDEMIKHWQSFRNPIINDVLINIELLEKDIPPLSDEELKKVATLLDACEKCKADKIDPESFILGLNQLPAPYVLYVIHKLQTLNQDLIMALISFAQKHRSKKPLIEQFYQRNMVFEKSQLLGRIFSTQRMETVLDILKGLTQEPQTRQAPATNLDSQQED